MKIEPALPNQPEPLKKDRGCAFLLIVLLIVVVAGAIAAWMLLWSGGHVEAEKEVQKPAPAAEAPK